MSQLYGEQGLLCRVSMNIVTLIRAVATTWELGVVKPHPQLIKDVTPFSSALVCSAMKPLPLPLAKPRHATLLSFAQMCAWETYSLLDDVPFWGYIILCLGVYSS